MTLSLTILIENEGAQPDLVAEHGFSVLINKGKNCLLYDTGQSSAVIENAAALGHDLSRISHIVLSHGHYDHTGGLPHVLAHAPKTTVVAHPAAFQPKYGLQNDGYYKPNGIPVAPHDMDAPIRVHTPKSKEELLPGIHLLGAAPFVTRYEEVSPRFHVKQHGEEQHDEMEDEITMVIETGDGLVVLTGCAHRGAVNIMHQVMAHFPKTPIAAIVGGFHLGSTSEEKIGLRVKAFSQMPIPLIYLAHCTGAEATRLFCEALPERCRTIHAGDSIQFA